MRKLKPNDALLKRSLTVFLCHFTRSTVSIALLPGTGIGSWESWEFRAASRWSQYF